MRLRPTACPGLLLLLAAALAATPLRAGTGTDNAGDPEYEVHGWGDAQNAGTGFGAWTLVAEATGDGYAGFFAADDADGSRGVDNIGADLVPPFYPTPESEGYVWATYANKGSGIDRATAFRGIDEPLDSAGDTFSVSYEHGFVNGTAGVALRNGNTTDTAADSATGARAQFYFRGGEAGYVIEDAAGAVPLDGLTAGLPLVPFTFFGLDVEYTLAGANTYDIKITKYNSEAGSGGAAPDVYDKTTHAGLGGRSLAGTGTIDSVALFQQDVETQSDAFFNNLAYSAAGGSGTDNASNYAGFWLEGDNFGSGFGPWDFASATDGGYAGVFIQTGSGNGIDNIGSPAPSGDVWASYANKGNFSDQSIQFRSLNDPLGASGDTFSVSLEHGYIDPGGKVGVSLRDGTATGSENPEDYATDALLQFYFEGGDSTYTLVDGTGEIDTGVGFSFFGVDLEVTLTGATTFDVAISQYNSTGDTNPTVTTLTDLSLIGGTSGNGQIDSLALFNLDAPNQSDVFFNHLSYENVAAVDNADFDGDDDVDVADLMILQRGFGLTGQGDNSNGDADGSGTVDDADLAVWQSQFGTGGAVAALGTIPEPGALLLAAVAAAIGASLRRRGG